MLTVLRTENEKLQADIAAQKQQAEELTQHSLAEIQTLDQWQQARPERQARYLEMMGLVDVPLAEPRPSMRSGSPGMFQSRASTIS